MLASDMLRSSTVAINSVNFEKNRYTDVVPCKNFIESFFFLRLWIRFSESDLVWFGCLVDNNRVVLNPCKDSRSSADGYVNASLIKVMAPYQFIFSCVLCFLVMVFTMVCCVADVFFVL